VRIVATAGHVDHGKSTLITFLTGTDPDRLAEEKRRGLTIDLGFASTTLPSGEEVSFVDVPGHARFIKNMLAGVGATHACLFVVAANEGWRPQSEEHLRVLDLLGMRHGLVVLTKVALVGDDQRALVELEVAEHLEGSFLGRAPIVGVDVLAGIGTTGEDGLASVLGRVLALTPGSLDVGRPRLWIDRSFPIRGSGTVVTGSLVGGTIAVGDQMVVEPQGVAVRVRGLQSNGNDLDVAAPGRRLAVNVSGIGHRDVARGAALVRPAQWHRATVVDASLDVLASIDREVTRRGAYFAHLGSGEYPVRLRPVGGERSIESGKSGAVRLWLPVALPLVPGDRYVLREAGRQQTVGGGEILDVSPRRPASRARPSLSLQRLVDEREWVEVDELRRLSGQEVQPNLGRWVVSPDALAASRTNLLGRITQAGPLGLELSALDERQRTVVAGLDGIVVENGRARLAGLEPDTEGGGLEGHPFLSRLRAQPFAPPDPTGVDRAELRAMERRGLVIERDGVWFAASAIDQAALVVAHLLDRHAEGVSVSAIREALGTSRKYVMPLLAHLDANGVTRRRGDLRIAGPRLAVFGGPEPPSS
jgi:selenocysteine-specific elongation factor